MLAVHFDFAGTHKWCPSRRLLPPDHRYRENKQPFHSAERLLPPEEKTHAYLMKAADDRSMLKESGVKGRNALMIFQNFDQGIAWVRDPFHVLKNTTGDMSALLSGLEIPRDPLVKSKVEGIWAGDEGEEKKRLAQHRLKDAHVPNTLVSKHFRNIFVHPRSLSGRDSINFAACIMKVFHLILALRNC
jgi:hypothetical protein